MQATPLSLELRAQELEFHWGTITALHDMPDKVADERESEVLLSQLGGLLGQAQEDLLIVSPYFVPGKDGTRALVAAARRGVRVRVVTNSLASTDVGAVHAGYKSSRRELLGGGVELFEMMPTLDADAIKSSGFSFSGSSGASLHAKMLSSTGPEDSHRLDESRPAHVVQYSSVDPLVSVIVLYLAIRLLDDLVIQPLLIRKSVHLHPMLLVITLIVGEKLFGVMGMILGVPVVTAAQKTVAILLEHRRETLRRETAGNLGRQDLGKSPVRPI